MHFAFTEDLALVRWILTNPRSYAAMRNDSHPEPHEFVLEPIKGVRWVIGWVKELPVAAVMVLRERQTVQLHFAMTPRVWGVSYAVAHRFLNWFWRLHKGLRKIVVAIPSFNKHAIRLAHQCGFRGADVVQDHRTKNGEPFVQMVFSMQRPKEARV